MASSKYSSNKARHYKRLAENFIAGDITENSPVSASVECNREICQANENQNPDSLAFNSVEFENAVTSLEINKPILLQERLKDWAISNKVNNLQLSNLLKLLSAYHPELPLDARSLLKTKRSVNKCLMMDAKLKSGQYSYIGIKQNLINLFESNIGNHFKDISPILLKINVDGIPLHRSTSKQFWPILCSFHNINVSSSPFCTALFFGQSKPIDAKNYLKDLVEEVNNLLENGFTYENVRYSISLKCFLADAPARAFLKGTKGHNAHNGCERCNQRGQYFKNRVIFEEDKAELRTDFSFKSQTDLQHHVNISILSNIHDVDMIRMFPLDYMHLVLLGCMRKLLNYWTKSPSKTRLPVRQRNLLSEKLDSIGRYIPAEFNRKCRGIHELDRWKAVEYRLFLLYIGPLVLKNILEAKYYEHFMLFHCAIRILCNGYLITKYLNVAESCLKNFVLYFPKLYGRESLIYNVHNLLHIIDDIRYFKDTLNDISCFPFESYLGRLKKLIRTPNKPFQQVIKKLSELPIDLTKNNKSNFEIKKDTLIFKNYFKFSAKSKKDSFVLLNGNKIFQITEICNETNIGGLLYSTVNNFYDYPIHSGKLFIFIVNNNTIPFTCKIMDFRSKCIFIPVNENLFYVVSLLHEQ